MRIKRLLGLKQDPALSQSAAFGVLTVMIAVLAVGLGSMAWAQPASAVQSASHSVRTPATAGLQSTLLAAHNSSTRSPMVLQSQDPSTPIVSALSQEYQNWLDQDVRWNITPAERTAFLSLASDPERDHFIEQFWHRRDPAGAPPNTFKVEHYRRLAYANQHFGASIPGWETDRGRIFILYGAPFSFDVHPAQSASDMSYETWVYQNAPGLGNNAELKFVDVCRCGTYQLQQQATSSVPQADEPEKALYDKGIDEYRQGHYDTARLALQTLINTYPNSLLRRPAQLAIAASWDQQGGPDASTMATQSYDEAQVSPVRIGKGVVAPTLTYSQAPDYPESAKQAKVQGSVILNLWVDEQGLPSHVRVVRGIAKDLDAKAVQAVQQYRFKPAIQSGTPVLVALNVEVNFQMF